MCPSCRPPGARSLDKELRQQLVLGDVAEGKTPFGDTREQCRKGGRVPRLDPDQDRAEVARRFLEILEPGDVVIGSQKFEEVAQRAGPLRQAEDEIFLAALEPHGPFLDLGQALEIEVAAGGDADHALAPDALRDPGQDIQRQRPGGLQHDALVVQHFLNGDADPVFRRKQDGGRVDVLERVEGQTTDAGHGGTVHEGVRDRHLHRRTRLQRRRQTRTAAGLDQNHVAHGVRRPEITDHPRRKAAAAHRQDQNVGRSAKLLHHLDGDGGLPLDPHVIEGQASVAVEMVQELGGPPDVLVLPVGGGGLSAGMIGYLRATNAMCDVVLVEPSGGPSLTAALKAGAPVEVPITDTFVDGAAVARIGGLTFDALKDIDPSSVLLAPENRICVTIQQMLNHEGVVLEPAGALSLDVLPEIAERIRGRRVVCVTSGGNFDFERLPEVKERAQRYSGVKKYFILRMPQRPGALREFLEILGPEDDIARFEYLKKSARNFGSVLIGIETTRPENFVHILRKLDDAGFDYRDITRDEVLAEFLI